MTRLLTIDDVVGRWDRFMTRAADDGEDMKRTSADIAAIKRLADPYKSHRRARVSFVLSPHALEALDKLAATGFHGQGRSGVARELMLAALRQELNRMMEKT